MPRSCRTWISGKPHSNTQTADRQAGQLFYSSFCFAILLIRSRSYPDETTSLAYRFLLPNCEVDPHRRKPHQFLQKKLVLLRLFLLSVVAILRKICYNQLAIIYKEETLPCVFANGKKVSAKYINFLCCFAKCVNLDHSTKHPAC